MAIKRYEDLINRDPVPFSRDPISVDGLGSGFDFPSFKEPLVENVPITGSHLDGFNLQAPTISSASDAKETDWPSLLSFGSGLLTNRANLKDAREQRAWAERLSSTTRQRDVKDLIAAGLNPILAAGGSGFGGHVSGGASARLQDPVHSALQSRMQTQEFKVMQAQRDKLKAETKNITNAGEKLQREGDVWKSGFGAQLAKVATTAGSAKGLASIVAILSAIPMFRMGRTAYLGAKGFRRFKYINKKTGEVR